MKRCCNALIIQRGASNVGGVARALVEAIDEVNRDPDAEFPAEQDPAVRLICHQLAFLLGVNAINRSQNVYQQLDDYCRKQLGMTSE